MAELSPQAQAVLTAATQRLYCLDPEDVPLSASEHGSAIAAALRTVADQVAPPTNEMSHEARTAREIRFNLLAIAAELKNQ